MLKYPVVFILVTYGGITLSPLHSPLCNQKSDFLWHFILASINTFLLSYLFNLFKGEDEFFLECSKKVGWCGILLEKSQPY
jgi:hypothetical protein